MTTLTALLSLTLPASRTMTAFSARWRATGPLTLGRAPSPCRSSYAATLDRLRSRRGQWVGVARCPAVLGWLAAGSGPLPSRPVGVRNDRV